MVHPVPSSAVASDLDPLEQHLVDALRALPAVTDGPPAPQEAEIAWRAQAASRAIDHAARWLQEQRLGFYTIGSAGHESNAYVALALRPSDPALLHYRSGGFYLARAEQAGRDGVEDVLLGMAAAADEPIAGGRHKVFGHAGPRDHPADVDDRLAPAARGRRRVRDRARPAARASSPAGRRTRSSCARSATPRSTTRRRRPRSTRRRYLAYDGQALPLLFVCEDNGLGISVPTPEAWVEQSLHGRPELAVERVEGDDPAARARDHPRARGLGARAPSPGRAPPPDRPVPEPRGRRPRDRLPHGPRDPRRLRPRPAARHGPLARGAWRAERRGAGRRLPRDPTAWSAKEHSPPRSTRSSKARSTSCVRWRRATRPRSPRSRPRRGRSRSAAHHARAGGQRRPRRRARAPSRDARVRGGRRGQGRRLRRDARAPGPFRPGARVRHAARRDLDSRSRARDRRHRVRADPGDPVPRVPPQRRGPAARRGGDAPVLLAGRVPERDGDPDPGVRLPEGLRRPLPQRQRARRPAGHPGARNRLARRAPTTRARCSRRVSPRRRRTAACACTSSRSRCTTRATCSPTATSCGRPSPGGSTSPSVRRAGTWTAAT